MPDIIKSLDKNLERWALLVFYVMLVATMFIEVVRREVFSYSSIWGEEIVRYSFIYLAWIGAAAAVKERGHIRIDVGVAAVAVIALYWSYEAVHVSWKFGSVTHGLRVSQVWFLSAVPIGFALVMIRLVQSFLRDINDFRAGRPVYEGDKLFD